MQIYYEAHMPAGGTFESCNGGDLESLCGRIVAYYIDMERDYAPSVASITFHNMGDEIELSPLLVDTFNSLLEDAYRGEVRHGFYEAAHVREVSDMSGRL